MKPEVYFLRYAYPCIFTAYNRGEISSLERDVLMEAGLNEKVLSRERLEKDFPMAFKRIKSLAEKLGKDKWDLDVLKEYFIRGHNEIIKNGEGVYGKAPESLKEFCKVREGEVVEIKGEAFIVKYEDSKPHPVLGKLVFGVQVGDKVRTHQGYAVEKV